MHRQRLVRAAAHCHVSLLPGRDPPREVHLAGGGNLFAHIAEALRARRRADVWPAGLLRRNARVPLSEAVSRGEATAGDLDAELEVCGGDTCMLTLGLLDTPWFSCQASSL